MKTFKMRFIVLISALVFSVGGAPGANDLLPDENAGAGDYCLVEKGSGRLTEAGADFKSLELLRMVGSTGKDVKIGEVNVTTKEFSSENKLKVYILPHSHNDAGWGMTFEGYYQARTKYTLDYIAKYMPDDPALRLMWTEISFFDLWWKDQDEETRQKVAKLIENKQLEFVGGGWVMTDEASVHYSAFVTELIEGHQWLKQRFNVTPEHGWTIDPFGLSPTFAFLTQRSGIKSLTSLRIHYVMKNILAEYKSLEFTWRQMWDSKGDTDIFSHIIPYDSYDSASTCGPEAYICTNFAKEVVGETRFNDSNAEALERRSLELVGQLKKKSNLFQTNNILYPLGGDFRFRSEWEWTQGFPHVKNIMNYVNSREDLHTEMKLVTLEEYFTALQADLIKDKQPAKTIAGDFFTYADLPEDYWSGYFTSRIFHKVTERQLMALTRTAQLSFTLMTAEVYKQWKTLDYEFVGGLLERVLQARRTLGLFQHHDGISGTSSDSVVVDYAKKLDVAINDANFIIQQCSFILTHLKDLQDGKLKLESLSSNDELLDPLLFRTSHSHLWSRRPLSVNKEELPSQTVTVVNSLAQSRVELVRLTVNHTDVKVLDNTGNELPAEIYPIFTFERSQDKDNYGTFGPFKLNPLDETQFELVFKAEFGPFETKNFKIVYASGVQRKQLRIRTHNSKLPIDSKSFTVDSHAAEAFFISNDKLSLQFTPNGVLSGFKKLEGEPVPLNVSFLKYSSQSGLYLFKPQGSAEPLENQTPEIVVVEGIFQSYAYIVYETVVHRVVLLSHLGLESNAIQVENLVDVRGKTNYELIMRIGSEIQTQDTFYTDSNGFQMMKRKKMSTFPTQGNYYPVPTSAFIEDAKYRMTLLTAQPGGGSSLESGQFEIMLDRIVNQDDNRGIGQGGTDNLPVLSKFKILLEELHCQESTETPLPALSLEAHHQSQQLLHPVQVFLGKTVAGAENTEDYVITGAKASTPCDVNLIGAFPLPDYLKEKDVGGTPSVKLYKARSDVGLVFSRLAFDERFGARSLSGTCDNKEASQGLLTLSDYFGDLIDSQMQGFSLTFVNEKEQITTQDAVPLSRNEVYSYKVPFTSGSQ